MNLVLKAKLKTTAEQSLALEETRRRYLAALNWLSEYAFERHLFGKRDLQRAAYYELKLRFPLPAQLIIRTIAQVRDAYVSLIAQIREHNLTCKPDKRRELTRIVFKQDAAVIYDERILRWNVPRSRLSLTSVCGRISLIFQVGRARLHLLSFIKGQAVLKRYGKTWYLFQTLDIPTPEETSPSDFAGVDVGICTIASVVHQDETLRYYGNRIRTVRQRFSTIRKGLQHRHTKSSKRRIKALGRKEARTVRTINHDISRRIVELAQRTNSALVLED